MSRQFAVTGILTALFFTASGQTGLGPTVAVAENAALPSFESARVVKYFGYEKAIELRNGTTRVVLCPEVGGRVLEYSLNGTNSLFVSDEEKAALWPHLLSLYPDFDEYQARTDRNIPVFLCTPMTG